MNSLSVTSLNALRNHVIICSIDASANRYSLFKLGSDDV